MVARRGRGAKAQAAKAKVQEEAEAQQQVEDKKADAEKADAEQPDQPTEEQLLADGDEEKDQNTSQESTEAETTDAENPPEVKEPETKEEQKEEQKDVPKVEPGKILVENLPPSFLFDYQEKLKELFSKHGEINTIKRGPMIVTELTTAPTLSAIVEFKNKDSVEKCVSEGGCEVDGHRISVSEECRPETAVLVGVPYEASTHFVRELFQQCGDITNINEFSKNKYKILRVTFKDKEGVEKALKLDRELRINGFLVTVSQYRDNDDHKTSQNNNKKGRNSSGTPSRASGGGGAGGAGGAQRNGGRPSFPRPPVQPPAPQFNARPNFRGGRGGGGGGGRGGGFGRGGFARFPPPAYLPHHNYLVPPGPQNFMNDGQRPNKRLRQM